MDDTSASGAHKRVAEPADQDIEIDIDIDTILTADAILATGNYQTALAAANMPGEGSLTKRLQLKALNIASNLNTALQDLQQLQTALDQDRQFAGQFAVEMHNWDRLMTQLEQHTKAWPNVPSPAENPNDYERLLQELKVQEHKIQALELKLAQADAEQSLTELPNDPYVNRLLIAANGNENYKYVLADNITMIGRDSKNDIQIRVSHVSRFHARLVSDASGVQIEDLDSLNGVRVNGVKVKRQKLRSGDLVCLGHTQLTYIDLMEGGASKGRA